MDYTEKKIRRINGYHGLIVDANLDLASLPNGRTTYREVVEHPGGVTVIPVNEEGYVYCVRQYRYCFEKHLLEVPAGKLEKGEDPFEAAKRELSEETGLSADEFVDLGKIYPSPGFCTETLYIYMARGLHQGAAHPDEDEFLDVELIHIDELVKLIMKNEICDAKTIVAVLKAKQVL